MMTSKAQKRCSGCYPSSPWQSSSDACTLRSVKSITFPQYLHVFTHIFQEFLCASIFCVLELYFVFFFVIKIYFVTLLFCFSRATRTWCKASAWTCRWGTSYFRPQAWTSFTLASSSSSCLSWIEFYFRFSQVATGSHPCFNESARAFLNLDILTCKSLRVKPVLSYID